MSSLRCFISRYWHYEGLSIETSFSEFMRGAEVIKKKCLPTKLGDGPSLAPDSCRFNSGCDGYLPALFLRQPTRPSCVGAFQIEWQSPYLIDGRPGTGFVPHLGRLVSSRHYEPFMAERHR